MIITETRTCPIGRGRARRLKTPPPDNGTSITNFGGAAAYTYLGTANYVKHECPHPMNITWKLDRPIPVWFLKKTNKLSWGTNDAKVLYAFMLGKTSVFKFNGYIEAEGTIRLYFTVEQTQKTASKSTKRHAAISAVGIQ